ncbi:MAG: DUF6186 family protein [Acidimicrobiales bacterium]
MYGTIAWLALFAASLALEVVARREPTRHKTLSSFLSPFASRRAGRCALLLFWGFAGVHLFARYTIPSHL